MLANMLAKKTDPLSPYFSEPECHSTAIRYMEVFRFEGRSAERLIPWGGKLYNCGLLKICGGVSSGYAEYVLPDTREYADLVRWASVFTRLKGRTIANAMLCVEQNRMEWGIHRTMLAEAALIDLAAHIRRPDERRHLGGIPLERSFLMDCSQAYYTF